MEVPAAGGDNAGAKAALFFREAITCRRYSLRVAAAHHPDCGIAPDYDREDQFPIPNDLLFSGGRSPPQLCGRQTASAEQSWLRGGAIVTLWSALQLRWSPVAVMAIV
jgi:hypothetical protein